ncbi:MULTISPECIES: hypothetical protein [unclassified Paraburkholderia]|uniref:hypothetical protein n=1 Tax=unclassified Paraburkholderia TaxID=2615204 RepID=UPI001C84F072
MIARRQFLGCLTALGGSVVLSACGGGGGGGGDSGTADAGGSSTGNSTNPSSTTAAPSAGTATSGIATSTGTTSSGIATSTSGSTTVANGSSPTASTGTASTGTSGSTSGDSSGAPSDPNSGSPGNTSNASPQNTTIPPATVIIDSQNASWTLVGGSVYRNGVAAGNTYNVSLILWYGGTIYHEGTGGQFYGWNGSGWQSCNDPRLGGTSADGTMIPPASYLIDKVGTIWTVVNGVVYRNRSAVGTMSNAALLLWYGGKFWAQSTGGQFYVCADADEWLPCNDPRIATAAPAGSFHGINGHYDYLYSTSQLVSIMQALGCSTYRLSCTDYAPQLAAVVALAQAFQPAGLTLFVLIDAGIYDGNGNLFTSESTAYTRGFNCAVTVATALQPYGVTLYECGNELTRANGIILDSTNAGTSVVDFNNANWPLMRGVMRGMIDGVKSVQADAKCGVNFCVADTGASDALWDGKQPDGTSGHPTVRWDLTTWHNYEVYGDIFDIGSDGSGPGFDLPTYCKARYGVPFVISEWNTGPEKTEAYRANYITSRLLTYYQARKTKNIQSAMYYELDSGDATYGLVINGTALGLPYNAFASFVASHPDS